MEGWPATVRGRTAWRSHSTARKSHRSCPARGRGGSSYPWEEVVLCSPIRYKYPRIVWRALRHVSELVADISQQRNIPRPPGVGEQQVSWMAVVFSHEKNEGWLRHPDSSGKVLGSWNRPRTFDPKDGEARKATRPASTLKDILMNTETTPGSQRADGSPLYTAGSLLAAWRTCYLADSSAGRAYGTARTALVTSCP